MLVEPCPFCGAKEPHLEAQVDKGQGDKWGYIFCRQCGSRGPEVRTRYMEPEAWRGDAIGEWNKRER